MDTTDDTFHNYDHSQNDIPAIQDSDDDDSSGDDEESRGAYSVEDKLFSAYARVCLNSRCVFHTFLCTSLLTRFLVSRNAVMISGHVQYAMQTCTMRGTYSYPNLPMLICTGSTLVGMTSMSSLNYQLINFISVLWMCSVCSFFQCRRLVALIIHSARVPAGPHYHTTRRRGCKCCTGSCGLAWVFSHCAICRYHPAVSRIVSPASTMPIIFQHSSFR
jgi:hypothetical protein